MPRNTIILAPDDSRASACSAAAMSAASRGRRSSGRLPLACACLEIGERAGELARARPTTCRRRGRARRYGRRGIRRCSGGRAEWRRAPRGTASQDPARPRQTSFPLRCRRACRAAFTAQRLSRQALGLADDRDDQIVGLEQPPGDALDVVERDGADQRIALVDVVDAIALEQEAQELGRDLGVGVEAQRERTGEIALGVFEFRRPSARRPPCA